MTDNDKTSVYVNARYDPTTQRMKGTAVHGNTPFDVPYISHIEGNLWQGGCANGLVLPTDIQFVVSLYPWEQYESPKGTACRGVASFVMYDNQGVDVGMAVAAARLAVSWQEIGPTLVHCQAGLNRSSLVAALALMMGGRTPDEAITLLRTQRSPAVLCNPWFEGWLRSGLAAAAVLPEHGAGITAA